MLCDGIHPHFDVSPAGHLGDAGDLPLPNTGLTAMREAMARQVPALIARHHMVWLGGDHSITLPLLRAYRAHLGQPLAVLHLSVALRLGATLAGLPTLRSAGGLLNAAALALFVAGTLTSVIRGAREPRASPG